MDFLRSLLSPLTGLLQSILELIHPIVGSYGLSIIILAIVVSVALSPVTSLARRLENKDRLRQEQMAPYLNEVREKYTGRERFEKTDEIYQRFNYHPIKSMGSLLPLFIQLPFLLAALFLLVDYPPLSGASFLFVRDLGAPDGLIPLPLFGLNINLLPILLTAAAVVESTIRPESTAQSRRRFLIIAAVLLLLIYPFPAAVCLYWLTSNTLSLLRALLKRQLRQQTTS